MLGPIFVREWLTVPRRARHYVLRSAYLGILWVLGLTAWQATVGWSQTATLGDNCSLLQGVTLGGTGKETGDRHPKIGANVMIGAGAKVLGNITVGNCCRIASGSVVLKDVPPETTVAGVPAKVVGPAGCPEPARTMDQRLLPDDCGCGS